MVRESWHWKMAALSGVLALVGIFFAYTGYNAAQMNGRWDGMYGFILAGIAAVAAVLYAAVISQFWNKVQMLEQPHKTLVWTVAVTGAVWAILLIVAYYIAVALMRSMQED